VNKLIVLLKSRFGFSFLILFYRQNLLGKVSKNSKQSARDFAASNCRFVVVEAILSLYCTRLAWWRSVSNATP